MRTLSLGRTCQHALLLPHAGIRGKGLDATALLHDKPHSANHYHQNAVVAALRENYTAYKNALEGLDYFLGYAVKANNNFKIMQVGRGAASEQVPRELLRSLARCRCAALRCSGRCSNAAARCNLLRAALAPPCCAYPALLLQLLQELLVVQTPTALNQLDT